MSDNQYIQNAKTASRINILAGIWLIFAPFILNFSNNTAAMANSIILGFAIGIAGLLRVFSPEKTIWAGWTNVVLGAWMILSSLILGIADTAAIWNSVILGLLVVIMASVSMARIRALHHHSAS